jgi:hypothetical protein
VTTKRKTAAEKADLNHDGSLSDSEQIAALAARIAKLERAMAKGGAGARAMYRNAK